MLIENQLIKNLFSIDCFNNSITDFDLSLKLLQLLPNISLYIK